MDTSEITPEYVQTGAAQTYVEAEFGGPVTESEAAFSLTASTPTRILENNPERLSATIINLGASDVYVWISDLVSSTYGIYLAQSGGSVNVSVRDDQMLPTREWWAYSEATGGDVFVISTYRYALS